LGSLFTLVWTFAMSEARPFEPDVYGIARKFFKLRSLLY